MTATPPTAIATVTPQPIRPYTRISTINTATVARINPTRSNTKPYSRNATNATPTLHVERGNPAGDARNAARTVNTRPSTTKAAARQIGKNPESGARKDPNGNATACHNKNPPTTTIAAPLNPSGSPNRPATRLMPNTPQTLRPSLTYLDKKHQ